MRRRRRYKFRLNFIFNEEKPDLAIEKLANRNSIEEGNRMKSFSFNFTDTPLRFVTIGTSSLIKTTLEILLLIKI